MCCGDVSGCIFVPVLFFSFVHRSLFLRFSPIVLASSSSSATFRFASTFRRDVPFRCQEKQAVVLTLHTDWSFRVWVTSRAGAGAKRRGGGLVSRVDARQFLGLPHERQVLLQQSDALVGCCRFSIMEYCCSSRMLVACRRFAILKYCCNSRVLFYFGSRYSNTENTITPLVFLCVCGRLCFAMLWVARVTVFRCCVVLPVFLGVGWYGSRVGRACMGEQQLSCLGLHAPKDVQYPLIVRR